MTTQHMHHEHNDADLPVAENTSVPETMTSPTPLTDVSPAEGQADMHHESLSPQSEETPPAPTNEYQSEEQNQSQGGHRGHGEQAQVEEPVAIEPAIVEPGTVNEVDAAVERPFVGETEVRPFTSFIEEFQQEQARINVPQSESEEDTFATFSSASEAEPAPALVTSSEETTRTFPVLEAEAPMSSGTSETTAVTEETQAPQTPQTQRPVSPLLRPASRIRVPRHQTRQREETPRPAQPVQPAQAPVPVPTQHVQEETPLTTATTETTAEVPSVSTSTTSASSTETPAQTPVISATSESQARPARRYRFDRPAPAASTAATSTPTEEHKEVAKTPSSIENGHTANGHAQVAERTNQQPQQGQPSQKHIAAPMQSVEAPAAVEPVTETNSNQAVATPVEHERRRRHGQERQREKEQAHVTPATSSQAVPTPVVEPVSPAAQAPQTAQTTEPPVVPVQPEEVNPEDLPPLEYADLQAANSRRRRRRRPTPAASTNTTPAAAPTPAAKAVTPEITSQGTPTVAPAPAPASASPVIAPHGADATAAGYNIVSGYTVGQMNQNGDGAGPFMGPEPSPARGSTPSHSARSGRAEIQRSPAYPPLRAEASASAASINHLANVVAQAIQVQSDRMVAELRRANQGPTNVSVTLPPFPSTERVGVFVDVANLLYSARTMRINIDFGKLLDFLRGNRRLVRAHAYCPTSPQPGDEQMFLQAVKGLGYRITTKNYKTFSSGAKKADLDLDLCMDVVRLVDGRAVDCIVLVSGDSDFMPMLDYCSDHGVRVEVAAFDEAMSATLRQSCDLFINLSMLGEIRA